MEHKVIIDNFVGSLMTVNHYALKVGLTTMGVYKQIERGKIMTNNLTIFHEMKGLYEKFNYQKRKKFCGLPCQNEGLLRR